MSNVHNARIHGMFIYYVQYMYIYNIHWYSWILARSTMKKPLSLSLILLACLYFCFLHFSLRFIYSIASIDCSVGWSVGRSILCAPLFGILFWYWEVLNYKISKEPRKNNSNKIDFNHTFSNETQWTKEDKISQWNISEMKW